jgi:pilus assembly protein CpaB
MNRRLAGVLAFGLVVSAVASLLLYRMIVSRVAAAAQRTGTDLVVAARPLALGTLIRDLDVKVVPWKENLPPQAATRVEEVIGRGVVANILEGEPIVESRLAPKGAGAGLAATIPVGMRAVAVRVNEVVGISGFATPGMRVDVLVLGDSPHDSTRSVGTLSKTLLQNIEVLSAGDQIQKDAEGKPVSVQVVNLLVTPEQAEVLSLASNQARIQLVLRNPLDREQAQTSGTAMSRLLALSAPPAAKPRPAYTPPPRQSVAPVKNPEPIVVEVFHGAARTEIRFDAAKQ